MFLSSPSFQCFMAVILMNPESNPFSPIAWSANTPARANTQGVVEANSLVETNSLDCTAFSYGDVLLGAPGIATRSKDATRSGIATRSKDAKSRVYMTSILQHPPQASAPTSAADPPCNNLHQAAVDGQHRGDPKDGAGGPNTKHRLERADGPAYLGMDTSCVVLGWKVSPIIQHVCNKMAI